jgi:hypothetical protein
MARFAAALMVALGGVLLTVQARETWLQPERFAATPGATLMLDLTSAHGFTGFETAIKAERVARILGRLGAVELKVGSALVADHSLRFPVTLTRPGVAVLGVELKPQLLQLEPEKIEAYFREIYASDELREVWAAVLEPRRWRESSTKHTKTFVRVGEPGASERAWSEPLGLALEIVPERDPTALKAGDALPVRVLRGGKPLAGFVLAYVSSGETREHVTVTDAEGRATSTLDAAGIWLVHGTDLRRVSGSGEREWESDFTTMVVEVR